MSARKVWNIIKDRVNISEEEFYRMVRETLEKVPIINEEAAAIMVAERLGISAEEILFPPIIGRILEIGPIRKTRSGAPYRVFTLVNEKELRTCVAFGEEHVSKLEELMERVVKISRYILVRTPLGPLTRVTEASQLEPLEDDVLPPVYKLEPAKCRSLEELKGIRGQRVVRGLVIIDQTTEIAVCPYCGSVVTLSEEGWSCSVHGTVEPEIRKVHRFQISDRSGMYPATYYGDVKDAKGKIITFKGMFIGEEIHISKIYHIADITEFTTM